jgi:hypothetical protein
MHRNPVKRGLVERPEDWLGAVSLTVQPGLNARPSILEQRQLS